MSKTPLHQISNTIGSEFSTDLHESCKVPPHFHRNFEIIAVIKGKCICSVSSQRYELSEGEAAFICQLQVHEFEVFENSSIRRINFNEHLILTIFKSLSGQIPRSPVFRVRADTLKLVSKCLTEFYGEDSGLISRIEPYSQRMTVKGLLYLLGGDFISSAELISKTKSDAIAMEIVEYIDKNFQYDISLHDIAKEMGYNYQYLSRIFNTYANMNFKKMLNQYRVQQAYALLQDTDLPISHICFDCGFQSLRSFNQVFKNSFGRSPKEMREKRLL